jgi:hypothetical protein
MKSPKIVLAALLPLLALGCSTEPYPAQVQRPPIPANLLSPCERPSPLLTGTFPEVAAKLVESSGKLSECAEKHAALVKAVAPSQPAKSD